MTRKIDVYTDGSATTADKPGGYGWVITINDIKLSEGSGQLISATNNDAELEASVQGLAALLKTINDHPDDFKELYMVSLVSDSQIVLNWANGTYRFKQEAKRPKYDQLMFLMKRLKATTRWVKGHSGNEHNERCDKLANEARKLLINPVEKTKTPRKPKKVHIDMNKKSLLKMYHNNILKIIDLDKNIIVDYNEEEHGKIPT